MLKWEIDEDTDSRVDIAHKLVPSTALKFPTLSPNLRQLFAENRSSEITIEPFTLNLHTIDLERFRVITLMGEIPPTRTGFDEIGGYYNNDYVPPNDSPPPNFDRIFDFDFDDNGMYFDNSSPKLYDYLPPTDLPPPNLGFFQWDLFSLHRYYRIMIPSGEIGNGSNDTNSTGQNSIEIQLIVRNEHTNDDFFARNDICRFLRSIMEGKYAALTLEHS